MIENIGRYWVKIKIVLLKLSIARNENKGKQSQEYLFRVLIYF